MCNSLRRASILSVRNTISLRETVAANVRAELGRSRITQSKAASAVNISEAALSKRLHARLAFDVDQLAAIAELVGVDPASLLTSTKASA